MLTISFRRKTAFTLLVIWIFNLLTPTLSYALTSGPSQPESQSFQPVGMSDMVDLSTGDFKYNIPLLAVDGYPLNLNYQSGIGPDDEASWVGLGWNLNVGAINRQLRGLPDDFGGDKVVTEHYTKPKITVGARMSLKLEIKGKVGDKVGKVVKKAQKIIKKATGGVTLTVGLFNDNYTGLGAEVGANAGMSVGMLNDGILTAGLGSGIMSNTVSGVDKSPYFNLAIRNKSNNKLTANAGLSISSGYNSRSGLKGLTLGASFSADASLRKIKYKDKEGKDKSFDVRGTGDISGSSSLISYNTEPIMPTAENEYTTRYGSFSFDLGPTEVVFYLGGGGTGYLSVRSLKKLSQENPGYGLLYADQSKGKSDALLDFSREKDNPIIPEIPSLALPVHLPDLFSYTSQGGSGQFRLYRGTGAFGDNETVNDSETSTLGLDIGWGASNVHVGVTKFNQDSKSTTRRWAGSSNAYLNKGDFQEQSHVLPGKDHAYFKVVGEKNIEDPTFLATSNGLENSDTYSSHVRDNSVLAVDIQSRSTKTQFIKNNGEVVDTKNLEKNVKQIRKETISYLTASEASKGALTKNLDYYAFNNYSASEPFTPPNNHKLVPLSSENRTTEGYRKSHHLSEITVTDAAGKRCVYGMPVYNIKQEETSFALGRDYKKLTGNNKLAEFDRAAGGKKPKHINGNDNDHYYHKEIQPAYPSSFLLTSILSPDYQDLKNDGISDDDNGTAIQFNYSKLSSSYKWRSPFPEKSSNINKCFLADPDDDKGSFVYGEKELCYLQSIKGKTQTAYFITAERQDALGVNSWAGGKNESVKQRYLKEIRLYSNFDSRLIKVVKFHYDYSLCQNTPNSVAEGRGKLTLKKVWFEYGNTTKGKYHPYEFSYAETSNGQAGNYEDMSTDRWGTYKPVWQNPKVSPELSQRLANDEFPYSLQDPLLAAENAALWHLNKIALPTGGTINITYESDDYAFVQDKRAAQIQKFTGLINQSGNLQNNALVDAHGLQVELEESAENLPPTTEGRTRWFKNTYLNGSDYLYTRLFVKMVTKNGSDFGEDYRYDNVSCYAKIDRVDFSADGKSANIFFERIKEGGVITNPMAIAAYQKLKDEYPRYAYPGYENRVNNIYESPKKAVKAVLSAFKNLGELKRSFYETARNKGFANEVNLNRSYIRLVKQSGIKLGGGTRVQKIQISDEWNELSQNASAVKGQYGQYYSYKTEHNNRKISSGVASYEPAVGSDENPLKQPVYYMQNIRGAINNYFSLEEPFGESFFPAPSVVYSKVTVTDLDAEGEPDPLLRTGYVVNEFYTAKDFPVITKRVPIKRDRYNPKKKFGLFSAKSYDELCLSQGYYIEVNDMHGKAKAVRVFNQAESEISSTEYYYNTQDIGPETMRLKNEVKVVREDGKVITGIIGRETDFFTDMREQESSNLGRSIQVGNDLVGLGFIRLPLLHWPKPDNDDYKLFRSVVAVKVAHYFGIVEKVVKKENGSSIATENVAYDGITGEPLITKIQNEFDQDIYSVNLPAYWIYEGMGPAYKNLGTVLLNLKADAAGIRSDGKYYWLIQAGDEIVDLKSGEHYWVIHTGGGKRLIKQDGVIYLKNIPLAKIIRSGNRNILDPATSNVVCMNNPIQNNEFVLWKNTDLTNVNFASLKVLDASVHTFDQYWPRLLKDDETFKRSEIIENKSMDFSFKKLTNPPDLLDMIYCNWGIEPTRSISTHTVSPSSYWSNFFERSGIEPPITLSYVPSIMNQSAQAFADCFEVTQEGTYTFVFAGVGDLALYERIDNSTYSDYYEVTDIRYKNTGREQTLLFVEGKLLPGKYLLSYSIMRYSNPRIYGGLEVYKNTFSQLMSISESNISDINLCLSSSAWWGNNSLKTTYFPQEGSPIPHYTNQEGGLHVCADNTINIFNPYITGCLGNWRPYESKSYRSERSYLDLFNGVKKGASVQKLGYFKAFHSYWNDIYGTKVGNAKWSLYNTATLYDKYGQELENKDALGRYSSAQFDFKGQLPASVASNAMNRELYTNSFEDNAVRLSDVNSYTTEFVQLKIPQENLNATAQSIAAHSGNYSAKLPVEGMKISTKIHSNEHKIQSFFDLTSKNEYKLVKDGSVYPKGFEPYPGKKYIFNAWVRDDNPTSKTAKLQYSLDGTNFNNFSCKAIVEGWKLIECSFIAGADNSDFNFSIKPSNSSVYIDDIRIHPHNSHMKSYVYNHKTFKLMAELDENCFATLYEYDNEGSLVRVKKETERGIMTIKESRSSYRRNASIQ